jgi:hypothetical protein
MTTHRNPIPAIPVKARGPAAVTLAAVILVGTAAVGAAAAADLSAYVGKYPFDKVAGRSLYEIPELRRDFVAKFGEAQWSRLNSYKTAAPIEAVTDQALGKVLVAWQCKPHDCPNEAVVLLNPAGTVMGACFATDLASTTSVEWLASGRRARGDKENCGQDAAGRIEQFKQAFPPK